MTKSWHWNFLEKNEMYYLELIERFWRYNEKIHIGSTAAAMYLYLIKTAKDHDRYDFKISDVVVAKDLKLTRKTVRSTKDKLRKLGLIEYTTENGLPCFYKIVVNYAIIQSQVLVKCKDEKLDNSIKTNDYKNFVFSRPLEKASGKDSENNADKPSKEIIDKNNSHIPSVTEFVSFAKTLNLYKSDYDNYIVEKYNIWKGNGWQNSSGHTIINWKSLLKNSLSFFGTSQDDMFDVLKIPDIKRTK